MSEVRVDKVLGRTGNKLPANLLPVTASAWANFGTGAALLRDNHNIASVTDNGTGDFTLNFATPMSNTNYIVVSTVGKDSTTAINPAFVAIPNNKTVNGVRITSQDTTGGLSDQSLIDVAIFGGIQ